MGPSLSRLKVGSGGEEYTTQSRRLDNIAKMIKDEQASEDRKHQKYKVLRGSITSADESVNNLRELKCATAHKTYSACVQQQGGVG